MATADTHGAQRVFISYAHAEPDEKVARTVAGYLENVGYEVFIDSAIPGGAKWAREIERQIQLCHHFVLLLSPQSLSSPWVMQEFALAQERRALGDLKIYPVRLGHLGRLPLEWAPLEPLQYLSSGPGQSTDDLCRKLAGAMRVGVISESQNSIRDSIEHLLRVIKRAAIFVALVAGAMALVVALGFLTTMAFNAALDIPREFSMEPLVEYLMWGIKSLIPPVFIIIIAILALALGLIVTRSVTKLLRRRSLIEAIRRFFADSLVAAKRLFTPEDGTSVAAGIFLLELFAFVAVCWIHWDILDALSCRFEDLFNGDVDYTALQRQRPQHWSYIASFTGLAALFAYLNVRLLRVVSQGPSLATFIVQGGAVVLTLVNLAVVVLPYRLVWYDEKFRCVMVSGRLGYVIAESEDDAWVQIRDGGKRRNERKRRDALEPKPPEECPGIFARDLSRR